MRKSMIGKSMLVAAALMLGALVACAEPKQDIGYDPHANAFEQLDAAVAKADAEDKLLLLISGGDWCKYGAIIWQRSWSARRRSTRLCTRYSSFRRSTSATRT